MENFFLEYNMVLSLAQTCIIELGLLLFSHQLYLGLGCVSE